MISLLKAIFYLNKKFADPRLPPLPNVTRPFFCTSMGDHLRTLRLTLSNSEIPFEPKTTKIQESEAAWRTEERWQWDNIESRTLTTVARSRKGGTKHLWNSDPEANGAVIYDLSRDGFWYGVYAVTDYRKTVSATSQQDVLKWLLISQSRAKSMTFYILSRPCARLCQGIEYLQVAWRNSVW